ncbi:MAG: hypothetical protein GY884_24360, partial [Proteobacteria bacterium]|nr:hypothetical protein [Pseudomonadota bacterium]
TSPPTDTSSAADTSSADTSASGDTSSVQETYACGWPKRAADPVGTVGPEPGDLVTNLELVDQCGETTELWDFGGSYALLYMTGAW